MFRIMLMFHMYHNHALNLVICTVLCFPLSLLENAMSRVITLNEFLIFEPDKKRITGRGRPAIISASASLCLELLIENAGHLVTHQQFYDYVWRRFGTEPTSTSLYQNISALRRAFNKAGLQEDIIRTMSRKGFLLSPQTTISKESIPDSVAVTGQAEDVHAFRPVEKIDTTFGEASVSEAPSEEDNKIIRSGWSKFTHSTILYARHFKSPSTVKKMLITGCLSILFFIFIYFYSSRTSMEEKNTLFSYSTNYRGCILYSKTDAFLSTEAILKKVDNLKIDCRTSPYIYLTYYENADRLSYFSCQNPLNTSIKANCRSFYYVKNFNDE